MMEERTHLSELNSKYSNLSYLDRIKLLFDEFSEEEILVTTSFGSTSVTLLHMINKVRPSHPIHLINTGYLFKETLEYKRQLEVHFGLNVIDVLPQKRSHDFTATHQVWKTNADFCCFINKVEPMNQLKKDKKVWVSGVLRFQNSNRANKKIFERPGDILKFHPILDMTREDLNLYQMIYELPAHPLLYKGFGSIGCMHCTQQGAGREGRWQGTDKTECGLHV